MAAFGLEISQRPSFSDRLFRILYWGAYQAARFSWWLRQPAHEGALVVLWQGDRLLLVGTSYQPFWSLPGGGIGAGEKPKAAALRELREELGLILPPQDLRFVTTSCHFWLNRYDTVHFFEAHLEPTSSLQPDGREIIKYRFVMPSDLTAYPTFPHLRDYLAARDGIVEAAEDCAVSASDSQPVLQRDGEPLVSAETASLYSNIGDQEPRMFDRIAVTKSKHVVAVPRRSLFDMLVLQSRKLSVGAKRSRA